MSFFKPGYHYLAAWAGIFLCTLVAQIAVFDSVEEQPLVSASKVNLLKNAVIPIYLSEDISTTVQQLESLIQETDIRQINVYTSDQKLLAQAFNTSVPGTLRETHIENMPMVFQGSLAGSVQLDIAYSKPEPQVLKNLFNLLLKSGLITLMAWIVFSVYLALYNWVLLRLHTRARPPGILQENSPGPLAEKNSSLLIYIYLLPEQALQQDATKLRDCLVSFSQKLESHLRIYGGRVLSMSNERIVCRMPTGQSQTELNQALTFCWGIARPMLYPSGDRQFQLQIKSLLHKTQTTAKSGDLLRAISEIDRDMENAVIKSPQQAHVTDSVLSDMGSSSSFHSGQSKEQPRLHQILSVKKSVDALWQKQESMVASNI